ncbi:MAG: hypothetical protein R3204_13420, partial [Oceanospirillum sp.]|nr:hypothetical protein [Oceanospirillum sp.]
KAHLLTWWNRFSALLPECRKHQSNSRAGSVLSPQPNLTANTAVLVVEVCVFPENISLISFTLLPISP